MKSLKMALLGATILVSAGVLSAADAADVYSRGSIKDTGPVDYLPAISWNGFYFGVNAGAAFEDDDNGASDDDDDTVFIGGLHVGYNWQRTSNLVLGVEGDVNFADDIDYLATLRGRIGLAAGPTLFYATGGVAFLGVEDEFSSDDEDFTGWVAGLGVEHKLRENVSVGLEGLYYAFDEDDDNGASEDEFDFWTVRARLTYHLGGNREPLK
jgi:outer membrane immunogenic protein